MLSTHKRPCGGQSIPRPSAARREGLSKRWRSRWYRLGGPSPGKELYDNSGLRIGDLVREAISAFLVVAAFKRLRPKRGVPLTARFP